MTLIADCSTSPVGCLTAPSGVQPLPSVGAGGAVTLGPVILLLNLGFKLAFIGAGLYAFINLITAGYQFISAGGDAKVVTAAWNKIQQTFMGVIIIVSSFLIAAIMGRIIFGDATYFLQPTLFINTPTQ